MKQVHELAEPQNPNQEGVGKIQGRNGNYKPRIIPSLKRRGNLITSPEEITDTFADQYENISRNPHKKSKQGKTE